MNHFALADNLLSAIGGTPGIAHAEFLPKYPMHELPAAFHKSCPST